MKRSGIENIYGADIPIVSNEAGCTVCRYDDLYGEAVISRYDVFQGVKLTYYDIHLEKGKMERLASDGMIEIMHCREGRMECESKGEFFYLSAGDLTIMRGSNVGWTSYFPLGHFHGIGVMIDVESVPHCLSCFLSDVDVCLADLADKYCGDSGYYLAREKPQIRHIFSELYSVPESIRKGYFKVKILELALYLAGMETEDTAGRKKPCTRVQTELAKDVCRFLTERMDERITLAQLSEQFHVSGTQIKNSFRDVYGISIYSYIREQKMQSAARMLLYSKRSILEIASDFGYCNGSKFSCAFKAVMGKTPNEYRNSKN